MTNGNQPTTGNEPSLPDLQNRLALIQAQIDLQQAQWQLSTAPLTAQLELLQKLFPQGQTAPPAGTITTTGDMWGFAAGISLAYEVIDDDLVDKLIAQLREAFVATLSEEDKERAKVLIVDKLQYAPDDLPLTEVTVSFESFKAHLEGQIANIDNVKNSISAEEDKDLVAPLLGAAAVPALSLPLVGLAAVPSLINTLAGVASHFQTTYSVTGQQFDVPTEGLLAAVASRLSKIVKVCISNFYAIGESDLLNSSMEVQNKALELKTKRDELANQIAKPLNDQIAILNQQIRDLESQRIKLDSATKQSEIEEINKDIKDLEERLKPKQISADKANAAVQASDVVLTDFATFTRAITTSADGQPTKLAQAILRDKVYKAGITHILFLKTIFSAGNAIAEEERFRSDKISYTGETGLSFLLATLDGDILSSGLLKGMRHRSHKL